jgi:hypothetical protein
MEEKNRGTHIWRGVEENAKQFIRMRKQHVLPMNPSLSMRQNHLQIKAAHHLSNHQDHNTLTFPALWELELYFALHIVCRCSIIFFVRIVLNFQFRSAGLSAGSQLVVNSSRCRQLKEYINY